MRPFERRWLDAAAGRARVDLLLKNVRLVNVFSSEIQETSVAIHQGRYVGLGEYRARRSVDLEGRYLAPGFLDAHCHIESSMLHPKEFARAVLPHGTTGVVADPHEIANVLGLEGIRYMVEATQGIPFRFHYVLPSCVPASPLETSGAHLGAEELALLRGEPWAVGLGEVMNFPGVVQGERGLLEKIRLFNGGPIDGHAPGLAGKELNAYIACGIRSDHESTSLEEALEKLRRGMWIMIRQGSTAKNLKALLPLVRGGAARRCMFVTDDRTAEDLLMEGHLDSVLAQAMEEGLDPVTAIQMVTLNPARCFGLEGLGAVAPGFLADGVVLSSLKPPMVEMVLVGGKVVYRRGSNVRGLGRTMSPPPSRSFKVRGLSLDRIRVRARGGVMRVMELVPGQILTRQRWMRPRVEEGHVVSDPDRDLLKTVVVERHRGTGNVGVGFVLGFGLKRGALASSVAHDSHNVVSVGVSDREIFKALQEVIRMGGGLVVVDGDLVKGRLPLPVAGLMSTWRAERVAHRHEALRMKARDLGCLREDPFMVLSFLALPVIPELKLTDRGLVDVGNFRVVKLFSE